VRGSGLPERSVADVLDVFATAAPAPGGGTAAALVAALAAALVAKAAGASSVSWPDAPGVAAQALALRQRCVTLADEDARVFDTAVAALEHREEALAERLAEAAEVPLRIADAAAAVAELAAVTAPRCKGVFEADAAAAALLAEGAARASARLVAINLGVGAGDERLRRADLLAADATRSAARALDSER
jgi:methenyltetrahydrofolate cyclohydrolase